MPGLTSIDEWTGNSLAELGLISLDQLNEASRLAESWGSPLSDVLLARKWIGEQELQSALANRFETRFVDLTETGLDPSLLKRDEVPDYMRLLTVPWRREDGRVVVATARPGPETLIFARKRWGRDVRVVVATKSAVQSEVQKVFAQEFSHAAVYDLSEQDPVMSARTVFTITQVVLAWGAVSIIAVGLATHPIGTLIALNALMTVFYLGNFLFKAVLVLSGGGQHETLDLATTAAVRMLRDDELPIYTILVPMFREPDVLPILAGALRRLDYPTSKLDVKIVLEEGDTQTIDAATALGLEGIFEIIKVPQSLPQTKPKACNYALQFARGEYLVIFDAEDKPEPDQLKKVVVAFRRAPENVACIQCRLNFFNREENILTRLFTLDYSLWFDLMLPGLEHLKIPIPLGGTSNHFKMSVLRELRAWDPFNVTEDADLGIRMTQKGYEVRLVDSTTYEEANVSTRNWIRQRSRWVKGYMQTFLVHTRRPVHLLRSIGPLGVLGFVFFIGGTILSGLLNPLFWASFVIWLILRTAALDALFPPVLLYFSLFNLVIGNALFIYVMMLGPFRRKWLKLVPYSLVVPWYWVLLSISSWKGAWQLITKPFYWEKTEHGLSKHTAAEVASASVEPGAAP